ncbi:MAG: peptidase [Gemmatimonadota bacterium]
MRDTSHGAVRAPSAIALVLTAVLAGCGPADGGATRASAVRPLLDAAEMQARLDQFAPTTLSFDTTLLDARQKGVVHHLVLAARELDRIFLEQAWAGNEDLMRKLAAAGEGDMDAARAYAEIMYGPWDRLKESEPFLDVGPRPAGAGYYPEDMSREEMESWLEAHPEDRDALTAYNTVVRRSDDGLVAVPYAEAYRDRLEAAAGHMRQAASLADNESLRKFLESRAAAFLSNEYFDSEVDWMRLSDNLVDPTIGPYEVYEDNLFGYKAAFEAFLAVRDPAESARLAELESHLPSLEGALPIPDEHKNFDRPFTSPISVVDEIYAAGDTRAGIQTIAFNLPNDPVVREQEGSKKVMLRNVIAAKFVKILRPIAQTVLVESQAAHISVDPYFTRVLMHELAHGLGPDYVTGQPGLTVNKGLKERYSAIEEAKADAVGTHSLRVLTERGVYTDDFLAQVYIDHVADMFRCVRFGVSEAHGKGCLTQFNFLREKGAITWDESSGLFAADLDAMPDAMAELAGRYLMLEATGDYDGAGTFLDRYGQMSPEMEAAIDRLAAVPVDIRPHYAVVDMMADW